jgi:hypothetical protein
MDSLANTISALPELQRQKKLLDWHTNVATAIVQHLRERELDAYFAIETDMMTKSLFLDFPALLAQIGPDCKGSARDKLRLFLMHNLLSPSPLSDSQYQACLGALRQVMITSVTASPTTPTITITIATIMIRCGRSRQALPSATALIDLWRATPPPRPPPRPRPREINPAKVVRVPPVLRRRLLRAHLTQAQPRLSRRPTSFKKSSMCTRCRRATEGGQGVR